MKKVDFKIIPWRTWAWLIPLAFISYTAIKLLFGRNPLSTYKEIAGYFASALKNASKGNLGPLLIFIFIGALVLCLAFYWTYWEEKRAEKILDKTELKEWAQKRYLKQHDLDSLDD